MKKIRNIFLIFCLLFTFFTSTQAEQFSDIVVTSPNGIWTDTRAYPTINDAITAIGAELRTLVISSPQSVTTLTIPANVTLKFMRDGQIVNSDQLTINTRNIIADSHKIFAGLGDIDFASGTEVKLSWFHNLWNALYITTDDTVTLNIDKPITATASSSVGNNVTLKFDRPGTIITANAGITISNIGQIISGNYQILAGAGNFRFKDGTNTNLSWFSNLRAAISHISTNKVTLVIPGSNTVDFSDSIPQNIHLDFISQFGSFSVSNGITLTLANSENIHAKPIQNIFTGLGSVLFTSCPTLSADYFGTLTQTTIAKALASTDTNKTILYFNSPVTLSSNVDWSSYTNIIWKLSAESIISHSTYSIAFPPGTVIHTDPRQIFNGTGDISGLIESDARWFGVTLDNLTDNTASVQKAIDAVYSSDTLTGGQVYIPPRCKYDVATQSHVQVVGTNKTYKCVAAHVSGVFAVDLAAGLWVEVSATTDGYGIPWTTGTSYGVNLTDIAGISRANPAVVTHTNHGLVTGNQIVFMDITQAGWTALNGTLFTITKIDDNSYSLNGIDTSGYASAYSSSIDQGKFSIVGSVLHGVEYRPNVAVIDDSKVYKRNVIMNGNSSGPWNEFVIQGAYHPSIIIDTHSDWPMGGTFGVTQGRGNRSGLLFRAKGSARWQYGNDLGNTGADNLSLIRNYPTSQQLVSYTVGGRVRYGQVTGLTVDHSEPTFYHTFGKSVGIEESDGHNINLYLRVIDGAGNVVDNAFKTITVDEADGQFHLKNAASVSILTFNDDGDMSILQPAPTAKTNSVTLTVGEVLTRIVQGTPTAPAAYTLPLGADCDAEPLFAGITNSSYDWSIINLSGANAITLTANTGHTIVGNAVVAVSTSALWRTRKSAVNTFITYRLN
jgi:hypothetical protein